MVRTPVTEASCSEAQVLLGWFSLSCLLNTSVKSRVRTQFINSQVLVSGRAFGETDRNDDDGVSGLQGVCLLNAMALC